MRPRIIFGVFSATQQAGTVAQLADSLAPHTVIVHHDFGKKADFQVWGPNVRVIPDPCDTGWGAWGFSESIFHTMRYCLENFDFDYFQPLSPTCLPVRPIAHLERRVQDDPADYHADMFPVDRDEDTLMTFGYRTYVPGASLRYRLLSRARYWYFGPDAPLLQTASLSVLSLPEERRGAEPSALMRLGTALTRSAARGWLGRHPFGSKLRPMIGSTWIGMRPQVVEYVVKMRDDPRVEGFFKQLRIVDETLFSTLLGNSPFRRGHSNHAINDFNAAGNPRWIDEGDLDRLVAAGRQFARKFPDDPQAPVRQRAIALTRG